MKKSVLIILVVLLSCRSATTNITVINSSIMETNGIPPQYVTDKFNLSLFNPQNHPDPKLFNDTLADGTVIEFVEDTSAYFTTDYNHNNGIRYDITITPPKPRFWSFLQSYDANGNILQRGKFLSVLPVGEWEYYDEQRNKIIKDEDLVFDAKYTYNDVFRFAHRKGLINLKTGEGRENIKLQLLEEGWYLDRLYVERHLSEYYILDKNTGRVKKHGEALLIP